MVVSLIWDPNMDPKFDHPDYWDPRSATPNLGKHPDCVERILKAAAFGFWSAGVEGKESVR